MFFTRILTAVQLECILGVYEGDNTSARDMAAGDGHDVRRLLGAGQPCREAQQLFIQLAAEALSSSGEKAGHDQD